VGLVLVLLFVVLGGCTRAHPPDVALELVGDLKTQSRAFMCDCSRCSLGLLCRGSHCRRGYNGCRGRRGKCGRSSGRRHLGRRDGRDRSK
jgi:hypothetical protein